MSLLMGWAGLGFFCDWEGIPLNQSDLGTRKQDLMKVTFERLRDRERRRI